MAQLLIIEDNVTMREGISEILDRAGHDVKAAGSGREGLQLFRQNNPDFVITDLKMEDMDGIEVLREIRKLSPEALVMLITAFGSIEMAVEAMKIGAFDFITKPFSPDLLRLKVSQALELVRTRAENQFLRTENLQRFPEHLIGSSAALRRVSEQIERVASADVTVLITGESGTGKELVARMIHARSRRCRKPFIKVDCTALAAGLLESELFGHERGAFTGAIQRKPGRFELADGGTIFLDEVGEIPSTVQLKLLRVIQDRSFERVGGTKTLHVDVRVISATNKNLNEEVAAGRFRDDLYHRLHVVPIHAPPLRERSEDIPELVAHLSTRLARKHGRTKTISPEAMEFLKGYSWPGNVRELDHLLERAYVLTTADRIGAEDLPESVRTPAHHVAIELPPAGIKLDEALEDLERKLILRAYEAAGRVKTRTAQLLGIKTSALYYKLEKYGIYKRQSEEEDETVYENGAN